MENQAALEAKETELQKKKKQTAELQHALEQAAEDKAKAVASAENGESGLREHIKSLKSLVGIKNESIMALEEEVSILRREDSEREAEKKRQLNSAHAEARELRERVQELEASLRELTASAQ